MSSLASFFLRLGFSADLLTSLSLGPSLVKTVALTGLLRRVGLFLSCFSLENALAIREERIPLNAVTGICLLLLGLFFLSHDSNSETWVCEFRWEISPRVSLSDAWVTGRGSPYYPMDNRVVAVRDVDVLPRCPMLRLLLFLVWSRVTICRVAVRDSGMWSSRSLPRVWIMILVGLRAHAPCGRVPVILSHGVVGAWPFWILSGVGLEPIAYYVTRACGLVDTIRHQLLK
ncbi:hypothetical protein Tco_1393364 [Tanacetum coccineum]